MDPEIPPQRLQTSLPWWRQNSKINKVLFNSAKNEHWKWRWRMLKVLNSQSSTIRSTMFSSFLHCFPYFPQVFSMHQKSKRTVHLNFQPAEIDHLLQAKCSESKIYRYITFSIQKVVYLMRKKGTLQVVVHNSLWLKAPIGCWLDPKPLGCDVLLHWLSRIVHLSNWLAPCSNQIQYLILYIV